MDRGEEVYGISFHNEGRTEDIEGYEDRVGEIVAAAEGVEEKKVDRDGEE
jgi:hypothetical protein